MGGSRTSNSREEHANGRDERGGMREERENRERREVNREQKQRQTREPTGFQRDEPSTLAVVGEGDGGSGTRREKGREEKRGGRTLGGGLLVRLLLLFVEVVEELFVIVQLIAQTEHFPIQTIILLVILSEELVSLRFCVGNLLL